MGEFIGPNILIINPLSSIIEFNLISTIKSNLISTMDTDEY